MDTDSNGPRHSGPQRVRSFDAHAMVLRGRACHSVRAEMGADSACRRAEDCPPYRRRRFVFIRVHSWLAFLQRQFDRARLFQLLAEHGQVQETSQFCVGFFVVFEKSIDSL